MQSRQAIERKLKTLLPVLSDRFSVSRIGYFGSFATDTQNDSSDLDVLVEFSKPVGWEFFSLEIFLEQSLNIKVDLVTPDALKGRVKGSILNQVHYI